MKQGKRDIVTVERATLYLWRNGARVEELGQMVMEKDAFRGEWNSAKDVTFTDLKEGDTLFFTARCTDNYGRTVERFLEGFVVQEGRLEFHGQPENLFG